MVDATKTTLKGVWYFDESPLPRANLANPYNLEPKVKAHATDLPVWDGGLDRWRVHNGGKFVLEIGNFLDFKPSELIRTISIVVDFRLMTPLIGVIASGPTWRTIGTLSSDITILLQFRLNLGVYQLRLARLD